RQIHAHKTSLWALSTYGRKNLDSRPRDSGLGPGGAKSENQRGLSGLQQIPTHLRRKRNDWAAGLLRTRGPCAAGYGQGRRTGLHLGTTGRIADSPWQLVQRWARAFGRPMAEGGRISGLYERRGGARDL